MPVADSNLTITDTDLDEIRAWVGDTPSDQDVDALWVVHLSVEKVALRILRRRYATFVANAETFNVQGDYSQATGRNIDALRTQIAQLEQITGESSDMLTTGQLARPIGR